MSLIEWLIFFLCYNLIIFGGTQKLFMLAGISSWKSIVPFYNIIKSIRDNKKTEMVDNFGIYPSY